MRKFENCDIFSVLGTIVAHNTKHYQTDFDIDKDILTEAAEENSVSDRRYLWMSRPCGTHCLKEKDVFLRDTSEYNTWTAYETGADEIVAYAIQVNGYEDGVLKLKCPVCGLEEVGRKVGRRHERCDFYVPPGNDIDN